MLDALINCMKKQCSCGVKLDRHNTEFIGIQQGMNLSLNLYNCLSCGTTVSERVTTAHPLDLVLTFSVIMSVTNIIVAVHHWLYFQGWI